MKVLSKVLFIASFFVLFGLSRVAYMDIDKSETWELEDKIETLTLQNDTLKTTIKELTTSDSLETGD